jgi:hypothetical protein
VKVRYLLDVHLKGQVARGLVQRGVDVLTAQEDGSDELADELLLMRAAELGRILISHDRDLSRIADELLQSAVSFGGVFYCHQSRLSPGELVRELEMIALTSEIEEWRNRIQFLPL